MSLDVRRVGAESAERVLAVVRAAFEVRPPLEPPAAALTETVASIGEKLAHAGGLLVSLDGEDVGALVLDPVGSTMYLRRFGVTPQAQGHGIARVLIDAAVDAAHGFDDLTVVAREELPATRRFWERQGFREVRRSSPNVELRRPLRTFLFDAPDAETMRELGASLAEQLAPGDLIVLSGELGAGKTTFTQGIGAGLRVRGDVTSPTFVIAREHPALDTSLEDSVTVVEWGEGVAEGLAESRLEVRIIRALADEDGHSDRDPRRVLMTPIGPRWNEMEVLSSQRQPLAEKLNENLLLDFWRCAETELTALDPGVPLPLSLMVAEHEGAVLLVHNAWRREWELPGGLIGVEETAREAAVREFREETGLLPGEVEFIGVGTVQVGHERRIEYAAVYRTVLHVVREVVTSDEIDAIDWWEPGTALARLSPIDAHLAALAVEGPAG